MDDIVLKFESLMSFWDLLREIEDEIKKRKKRKELVLEMENSVNYNQLFKIMSKSAIDILNHFQSPTQIWKCINFITVLIEGCNSQTQNSNEALLVFKDIDFPKLLSSDNDLLKEALIDMCK